MSVAAATVRKLASKLPEAVELPHHAAVSFRVRGKIFATMPSDAQLNAMLPTEQVDRLLRLAPQAVEKLYWGAKLAGAAIALERADKALVELALHAAWQAKAPAALHGEA